jgi:PPP family 3-phenylpropionic acid transporter
MGLFYFGYFILGGVTTPFFPPWLELRGLTETEIANCIAIPLLVRVLLTPLAGYFADRATNRRMVVRFFVVVGTVLFLFAYPAKTYLTLLVTTGAAFVLWGLALPVVEALALTGVRRFGLDYGRMRRAGSISFIIANLGSGALLSIVAPESIYWMILAALIGSAVVAFILPVTPPAVRALDDATRPRPRSARVFSHPGLLALFFAAGLVQCSHAVLYSFGSIYWQSLGFDGVAIGAFWATSIVFEVALFTWSRPVLHAIGPFGLLIAGALGAIVRWAAFPFDVGFAGFALLQVLHVLTFASGYLGVQHIIARMVPEQVTASAQGMYVMISGILLAATTSIAGLLYRSYGPDAFWFMIAPAVLSLAILAVYRLVGGERP